jgi:capsular polysaccharide biosynthesis protein
MLFIKFGLDGLIGAGITSIVLIIRYMMNDTIKTSEDIEKYLGITTLGVIPLEDLNTKSKRHKSHKRKANEIIAS